MAVFYIQTHYPVLKDMLEIMYNWKYWSVKYAVLRRNIRKYVYVSAIAYLKYVAQQII